MTAAAACDRQTVGQCIRYRIEARDTLNVLVDPASLTVTVLGPDGPVAYSLSHDSTGVYHLQFTPQVAGQYTIQVRALAPDMLMETTVVVVRTRIPITPVQNWAGSPGGPGITAG